MKKSEIVKELTTQLDITVEKASKAVNIVFETIAKGLEAGDSYNHDKFGTFKVVESAPRKGRNPQTGETVDIPAKKKVKLVVSGHLKKTVNGESVEE